MSCTWSSLHNRGKISSSLVSMSYSKTIIKYRGCGAFNIIEIPPSSTCAWIAFIDIIDAFHLGSPYLHSYHCISYPLCVDVQHAFHIPLINMAISSFDIATWHAFLLFPSWCFSRFCSPPRDSHLLQSIHSKQLGNFVGKTHKIKVRVLTSQIFSKITTKIFSPPSTWLCHTQALTHLGE